MSLIDSDLLQLYWEYNYLIVINLIRLLVIKKMVVMVAIGQYSC